MFEQSGQNYEKFKLALIKILSDICPERDPKDYDEDIDLDTGEKIIAFTFYLSEEEMVDRFARTSRKMLLKYPRLDEDEPIEPYVFTIWKNHIGSHDYWCLSFWLSSKYEFTENSQP